MSRRWQPPHPARTIRRRACPTGRPFATRWLALAGIPVGCNPNVVPTACPCGGWHLTESKENP